MTDASTPPLPSTILLPPLSNEPGSVLVRVMEECLIKLEAGEPVDRTALRLAHPELSSQLDACLASLEFIHQAAQPGDGVPTRLGDFRIVREIGRGGMGVVYEAEQVSLKRQVALKVLRFGTVADAEAMQRFQREAETIAALHHTNIVPVFAIGAEQSIHYYAMQFIQGRSLREITLDAASTLPPLTIAQWGLQAADALAHAHQRNVVHRDIKPSNLILGDDGRIWLTDFGLAKRLDDVTLSLSGALLGTPRYMSPEQASAMLKPVDHRTDIYSLGATLYELITKRPLFASESPHVIISQILSVEPPPPREFVPDIPRDLETIVLKCLNKDASLRYQTAQALADDLRAFHEGRAIKARRASAVEQAVRWAKQNRKQLVTAFTAIAVTVVAMVGGTAGWSRVSEMTNGSLVLKTKEGPLLAEILNANGDAVLPSFTVPNEQPLAIAAGEYRLRVSGRGALSKTAWLRINRFAKTELEVELDRDELRPPLPVNGLASYEFVDFGDGPDLITLPRSPSDDANNKAATRLQRISQKTGEVVWSIDVSKNSADLKPVLTTEERKQAWWSATVFGWQLSQESSLRVLRPLPDIDGDGTPDLIWRLHQGLSVFAVSGKTGQPLLWHRPDANVDGSHNTTFDAAELVTYVTADGTSESSLVLSEVTSQPASQQRKTRLTAIRLRDQSLLWSRDIQVDGKPKEVRHARLRQTLVKERPLIVFVCANRVLLLDPENGKTEGEEIHLDSAFTGELHVQDLDGDGLSELVLMPDKNGGSHPHGLPEMQVVSLGPKGSGSSAQRPNWKLGIEASNSRQWRLNSGSDLNGDGVHELILSAELGNFDCRCLDARTGKELWTRSMPAHFSEARLSPALIGEDIDHDGWRDVFLMSIRPQNEHGFNGPQELYADCFSGKDGHSLWWSKQVLPGKASPFVSAFEFLPQWWEHGPHGAPALLVSLLVEADHRQGGILWTIDARTGRFLETASHVLRPELHDCNRDGRDELCVYAMPEETGTSHFGLFQQPGELHLFKGQSPIGWRAFGDWQPLSDVNGDGLPELWRRNHRYHNLVPVISGRDGSQLTTWNWSPDDVSRIEPLTGPHADLDRDGVPDLVGIGRDNAHFDNKALPSQLPLPVMVVSGKNGVPLWPQPQVASPGWKPVSFLYQGVGSVLLTDIDADDVPELVVPHYWETHQDHQPETPARCQYGLAAIDLRTGTLKWQTSLFEEPAGKGHHFWSSGENPFEFISSADLDGDRTPDFLIGIRPSTWDDGSKRSLVIQARNGRDGQLMWPEVRGKFFKPEVHWRNYLQGAVANVDGKGGSEVVLLDFVVSDEKPEGVWKGDFELLVLDGKTGKSQWEKRWPGNLDYHGGFSGGPRLLTLRQKERDAIVVLKPTQHPHGDQQQPLEDWLLGVASESTEGVAAGASQSRELAIQERRPRSLGDLSGVLDLKADGVDELVSWRTHPDGRRKGLLQVSRGLQDELWSAPLPNGPNGSDMPLKSLNAGKTLFLRSGDWAVFFSADGKLLSQVSTPPNQQQVVAASDQVVAGLSVAANPQTATEAVESVVSPRLLVHEKGITRSDLILPLDADGRLLNSVVAHDPLLIRESGPMPRDQRLLRALPWANQNGGKTAVLMILSAGLSSLMLLLIPFYVVRYGWRERRSVWPLVWSMLGVTVWLMGVWQILVSLGVGIDGTSLNGVNVLIPLSWLSFGLPLAWSPVAFSRWFPTHSRRPVIVLVVTMIATTLVVGTVQVLGHRVQMHPAQSYDWTGWYELLPLTCYGGLSLLFIARMVCSGVQFAWSIRPWRKPPSPATA